MESHVAAVVAGAQVGLLLIMAARRARSKARRWMKFPEGAVPFLAGKPVQGLVRAAHRVLPPASQVELALAGFDSEHSAEYLTAVQLVAGLLGLMLPTAAGLLQPRLASPLLALAGGAAGFLGPRLWLERRAEGRREAVLRALPGVIDLLSVCSASGLNLTQSLQTVATHQQGPLGEELRQAVRIMQAGRGASVSVRAMADRLKIQEVTSLANAVVMTESLGTPVTELFRTQAAVARTQQRRRVEDAIGKLPMKFTVISALLILPSLFVLTVLPSLLTFVQSQW